MFRPSLYRFRQIASLFVLAPLVTACSVRGMAINSVADALSASGTAFASDSDPELIRAATPFALKTMESLLEEKPQHAGLLLALTSGFTQYAYAYPETDALLLEAEDRERSRAERQRAVGLYLRGRDYGLRGLELRRAGVAAELRQNPEAALATFDRRDVPLLYWTGAAWGAAIGAAQDDLALVADFPAERALLARALELDPAYDEGALHEAMIAIESLPELMGGSAERARRHYEAAVALSKGMKASPHVALAMGVTVPSQDRREFESLLRTALSVDPDAAPHLRLANLITQRRARYLLERADYLFIDDASAPTLESAREGHRQ